MGISQMQIMHNVVNSQLLSIVAPCALAMAHPGSVAIMQQVHDDDEI